MHQREYFETHDVRETFAFYSRLKPRGILSVALLRMVIIVDLHESFKFNLITVRTLAYTAISFNEIIQLLV